MRLHYFDEFIDTLKGNKGLLFRYLTSLVDKASKKKNYLCLLSVANYLFCFLE